MFPALLGHLGAERPGLLLQGFSAACLQGLGAPQSFQKRPLRSSVSFQGSLRPLETAQESSRFKTTEGGGPTLFPGQLLVMPNCHRQVPKNLALCCEDPHLPSSRDNGDRAPVYRGGGAGDGGQWGL